MEKAHDTSTSPATECTRCAKVPISNLRQHNLECKRITIDTGEESLEEEDRLANEVITVVNDGEGPWSQTWSSQLKLLFPDAEIEYLDEIACQVTSLNEAAGYVLDKFSTDLDTSASLKDLIDLFVKKNSLGNSADDEHVAFDLDTLWMDIIKFYKKPLG